MPTWLLFLLTAVIVIGAGVRLARDGDVIASHSKLGATWVGAILVAGATSLPEISTNVAAVAQGDVDLAIGNLFGSSMTNMLILALADLLTRQRRLLEGAGAEAAVAAAIAVSLTAIASVGILSNDEVTVVGIGWCPLVIALGYVVGMRILHQNRTRNQESDEESDARPARSLGTAIAWFVASSAVILAVAPQLAQSGAQLAEQLGLSTGFFGVLFLGAVTSLPESAVVVTAVRQGAYDLAMGSLLGSNSFNMLILMMLDVTDGSAALLSDVGAGAVVAALVAIVLMSQTLLDLLNRPERRSAYLEPGPVLMIATYGIGLYLAYRAMH